MKKCQIYLKWQFPYPKIVFVVYDRGIHTSMLAGMHLRKHTIIMHMSHTYTYTHTHAHTYTHARAYINTHARTHTHKQSNTHRDTHRHKHTPHTHERTHAHTHTHTHTHTHFIQWHKVMCNTLHKPKILNLNWYDIIDSQNSLIFYLTILHISISKRNYSFL